MAQMLPPIAMSVSYSVHSATSNGASVYFAKDHVVSECRQWGKGEQWTVSMTPLVYPQGPGTPVPM